MTDQIRIRQFSPDCIDVLQKLQDTAQSFMEEEAVGGAWVASDDYESGDNSFAIRGELFRFDKEPGNTPQIAHIPSYLLPEDAAQVLTMPGQVFTTDGGFGMRCQGNTIFLGGRPRHFCYMEEILDFLPPVFHDMSNAELGYIATGLLRRLGKRLGVGCEPISLQSSHEKMAWTDLLSDTQLQLLSGLQTELGKGPLHFTRQHGVLLLTSGYNDLYQGTFPVFIGPDDLSNPGNPA